MYYKYEKSESYLIFSIKLNRVLLRLFYILIYSYTICMCLFIYFLQFKSNIKIIIVL